MILIYHRLQKIFSFSSSTMDCINTMLELLSRSEDLMNFKESLQKARMI